MMEEEPNHSNQFHKRQIESPSPSHPLLDPFSKTPKPQIHTLSVSIFNCVKGPQIQVTKFYSIFQSQQLLSEFHPFSNTHWQKAHNRNLQSNPNFLALIIQIQNPEVNTQQNFSPPTSSWNSSTANKCREEYESIRSSRPNENPKMPSAPCLPKPQEHGRDHPPPDA